VGFRKRAVVFSLVGLISDLAFNFVWIFYGTTIVCLALSGYDWSTRASPIESRA
jgi:hypothetical protein